MPSTRLPAVLIAADPAQLSALKSRLRGRICDVVYHQGAATVHEIADRLSTPVSTLYGHLEQLVDVGLLCEGEPVRTTKNYARSFTAPARELRVAHDSEDPEIRAAIADVVASQLRASEREFRNAVEHAGGTIGKPDSQIASGSTVGWLRPADVRRLNKLLAEVMTLFEGSQPGPGLDLQAITFVSRPVNAPAD